MLTVLVRYNNRSAIVATCPTLRPIIPIKAIHFLGWLCSAILVKRFVLGSSSPVNGLDQVQATYLFPFARNFWPSAVMTHTSTVNGRHWKESKTKEERERERERDSGSIPTHRNQ
jgi:hypothetical protein